MKQTVSYLMGGDHIAVQSLSISIAQMKDLNEFFRPIAPEFWYAKITEVKH